MEVRGVDENWAATTKKVREKVVNRREGDGKRRGWVGGAEREEEQEEEEVVVLERRGSGVWIVEREGRENGEELKGC